MKSLKIIFFLFFTLFDLDGAGTINPRPHSSYIQKPTIRVKILCPTNFHQDLQHLQNFFFGYSRVGSSWVQNLLWQGLLVLSFFFIKIGQFEGKPKGIQCSPPLNPIGAGGTMCPHFFIWKKGSEGPKFLDFSWFIINFQKIKSFWFFTVPPSALKLHSKAPHY